MVKMNFRDSVMGNNRDWIGFLGSNVQKLQLRFDHSGCPSPGFTDKCEGISQNCQRRLTNSLFRSHQQVRPLACKMSVNSKEQYECVADVGKVSALAAH
jgi:hypothetical protein